MKSYLDHGFRLLARRWKGQACEIDLILSKDGEVVFVEVKSSRTQSGAAAALKPRQTSRLLASAEHALGYFAKGSLCPMRIDVALVGRDDGISVIPNALAA